MSDRKIVLDVTVPRVRIGGANVVPTVALLPKTTPRVRIGGAGSPLSHGRR